MCWRRRRSPTAPCCAAASGKAAGFTLAWEEKPYEWIREPPLPPGPRLHQGAVPPLRAGVRYRAARAGGSKVSYALEWEPLTLVGRLFGARLADRRARWSSKRMLQAVAFAKGERADHVRPAAARAAGRRARARGGARRRDRPQPLRQRARPAAERLCAGRHGERSRASQAQARWRASSACAQRAAIEACLAAVRAGPAVDEMGPAVHQLPRRPSSAPRRSPSCRAARTARRATSTTTATSSATSSSPSRRRRRSGR